MDHNPEGVRWGELPCLALVGLRNSEAESRGQTIEPPALPPADFVFPLPHKHQLQFVWLGGLFLGDLFLANLIKFKIGAHFPDLVLPNPQLNPWMLNNTSDLTIERIRVPPINYPRTEALLSAAVQHLTLSKLCATPRDTPRGEGIYEHECAPFFCSPDLLRSLVLDSFDLDGRIWEDFIASLPAGRDKYPHVRELTLSRMGLEGMSYNDLEFLLGSVPALQRLVLCECAWENAVEILQLCYVLGFEKSRSMMELLPETTRFLSVKLCFEYALVVDDEL
jgi:hypothetical protein